MLIALDCDEARRHGLMGFAFKRETVGAENAGPKWLRSLKVFKSIVPNPKQTEQKRFSTWEHPIQSFLWSDYTAMPDTLYKFTIVPMYGNPGNLKPQQGITFEIRTEKEFDKGHGVWFNRGAIASQAFARQFSNKPPSEPDNPTHDETVWLSRGLLDACLLIRGDTRVADIYLTEFDRIFRHFYFRDVANEIEAAGNKAEGAFLYETSQWTDSYFKPDAFKTRRREMFFADSTKSWVMNAAKDV